MSKSTSEWRTILQPFTALVMLVLMSVNESIIYSTFRTAFRGLPIGERNVSEDAGCENHNKRVLTTNIDSHDNGTTSLAVAADNWSLGASKLSEMAVYPFPNSIVTRSSMLTLPHVST
ncbi:hypothetical protein IFR05_005373 [Cadophora sp. M221]|nr:hypothetical protein IFR05_005373 [Cadophora sp. M221]